MPKRIQLLCSDRGLPTDVFVNNQDGVWGGVDRGTKILLEQGIQPYLTVGDFDSVSDEERRWIAERTDIAPVPAEKADTDLALGVVKAIEQGFEEIDIYGATGGRLDHFMGAMQLLKAPENQTYRIRLLDDQNEISLLTEGEHVIDRLLCYPYISFVPATDAVTLSLKGFKYNLDQEVLKIGSTLTISNEFQDKAGTVYVHRGMVYQMRSRDK
ncbi:MULTISPECIES: thiamine diphosphokinase [unclassified Staphylococcus]|uniref:thiamine diphosphokinase n=1 Tax=unclassified Staphylococcus TaxID=91994 RepID=UPI0021CFBF87|nr:MULTISPECIES: thiamine diphosphokinase [unclassified Staphylococcus]UXR70356.1 thiamine diphosphokinase [Staphylococcus sp. IVB6246]UXR72422.1 thiamine diphosphokinase [Staphylococcus sp. IVB6240]UXR74726.1 thiamine diphosphokinase [Staphylococcus sp. IVB6238]UXR77059.1 thiamine diphosphokinase [Staphylococcus sp. IVB6233]UXR81184.1 thiamine diphosphokinase [Staphylococcus sp. IVB6218]